MLSTTRTGRNRRALLPALPALLPPAQPAHPVQPLHPAQPSATSTTSHPYLARTLPTGPPKDEQLLDDTFNFDDGLENRPLGSEQFDLVVFVVNDNEMAAAQHFFQPWFTVQVGVFLAYACTCPALLIKGKVARVLLIQQSKAGSRLSSRAC